jgi:ABC-type glycerol-3-phosphate transport system permease component
LAVRTGKLAQNILLYSALLVFTCFSLFPIVWTLLTSLKTPVEAFSMPPQFIFIPRWENYLTAWSLRDFSQAYMNTLIISLGATALTLALSTPAAYSLARFRFRGSGTFSFWLLATRMLPEMLFIIPLYVAYQTLGLYDTLLGMVIIYQIYGVPFSTWIMKSFIQDIPREIEESALVDGCSSFGVLLRITLPLSASGLAATAALAFIGVWVDLLFALSFTFTNAKMVSVAIASFKGYAASQWPIMAAGSILAIIPQIIFFVFVQKYIVRGLTFGALKA